MSSPIILSGIDSYDVLYSIPKAFSAQGEKTIYCETTNSGDDVAEFALYDGVFNEKGKVTFKLPTYTRKTEVTIPKPVMKRRYDSRAEYYSEMKDMTDVQKKVFVESKVREYLGDFVSRTSDASSTVGYSREVYYVFYVPSKCSTPPAETEIYQFSHEFDYWASEEKALDKYVRWSTESDIISYYTFSEEYFDGKFDESEYVLYEPECSEGTATDTAWARYLDLSDGTCGDGKELFLTQTFFNDDDGYEYIVPIIYNAESTLTTQTYVEYMGYSIHGRETINYLCRGGFEVLNDKGATVKKFQLPDGLISDGNANLAMVDDRKYLICRCNDGDGEGFVAVFDVDSDSSGIAQPRMVQKVGIRPAVVHHGESVTVTGEGIESVSVISVSGKSELNMRGKGSSVEVPTSGLGKGVHIVDVTAGGTHTSQKVVVR